MRMVNSYLLSFTPFYYADKSYKLCFYFYSPVSDITTPFDMSAWLLSCYTGKELYPVEAAKKGKKRRAFVALPEVKSLLIRNADIPELIGKAQYNQPLVDSVNTLYLDAENYCDGEIQQFYNSVLLNNAFEQVKYEAGAEVVDALLPVTITMTQVVLNSVLQKLLSVFVINDANKIDVLTEYSKLDEGSLENIEMSSILINVIEGYIQHLDDSVIQDKFIELLNSTTSTRIEPVFTTYLSRQTSSFLNYLNNIPQPLESAYALYNGSIVYSLLTNIMEYVQDVALQDLFSGRVLHEILGESCRLLNVDKLHEALTGEVSELVGGANSTLNSGEVLSLEFTESVLPAYISLLEDSGRGLSKDIVIDNPPVDFAIYHTANNTVDILGDAFLKVVYEGSRLVLVDYVLHNLLSSAPEKGDFAKELSSFAIEIDGLKSIRGMLTRDSSIIKAESSQGVFALNTVVSEVESSQGIYSPDAAIIKGKTSQGVFSPNALIDEEEFSQGVFSPNALIGKEEFSQGIFTPNAVINVPETSEVMPIHDSHTNEPGFSQGVFTPNAVINKPETSEILSIYDSFVNKPETSEIMSIYDSFVNKPETSEITSIYGSVIDDVGWRAVHVLTREALIDYYFKVIPSYLSKIAVEGDSLDKAFIRSVMDSITMDVSTAVIDKVYDSVSELLDSGIILRYFDSLLDGFDLSSLLDIYPGNIDFDSTEVIKNELDEGLLFDDIDRSIIFHSFSSIFTKEFDFARVNDIARDSIIMKGFDLLNRPLVSYGGYLTGNPEYSSLSAFKDAIYLKGFDMVVRDRLFISILSSNMDYAFLRYVGTATGNGKFDLSNLSVRDVYGNPGIVHFSESLGKDAPSASELVSLSFKASTIADSRESDVIDVDVIKTEYLADSDELEACSTIEKVYDGGVIKLDSSNKVIDIVQSIVQLPLRGFGLIKDIVLSVMDSFTRTKKRMRIDDDISGNKPEDIKIPPQPNKRIWLQQGKSQSWHIWPRRKTR